MLKPFEQKENIRGKRIGVFGKRNSGKTLTMIDLTKKFLCDSRASSDNKAGAAILFCPTFEISQWRDVAQSALPASMTVVKDLGYNDVDVEKSIDILKMISERENLLFEDGFLEKGKLLLIFDDCLAGPKKFLRSEQFIDLWQNVDGKYDGLTMIISCQYVADLSPHIRKVLDIKMFESKCLEMKSDNKRYSDELFRSTKKLDEMCRFINMERLRKIGEKEKKSKSFLVKFKDEKEDEEIKRLQEKSGLQVSIVGDSFPISNFFYYDTVVNNVGARVDGKSSEEKSSKVNSCPLMKKISETVSLYQKDDEKKVVQNSRENKEEFWKLKPNFSLRQRLQFSTKKEGKKVTEIVYLRNEIVQNCLLNLRLPIDIVEIILKYDFGYLLSERFYH